MNKYEVMLIFDTRAEISVIKEWFKSLIQENGGSVETEEEMGLKKLAYPIKKKEKGIYYLFYVKLEPQVLNKIYKELNLKEEVLRYIFIKIEKE